MLLPGITVTFSLANIFYLIRVIKKYRHLANLQSYLTGFRHLNVSEVLKLFENKEIGYKLPIIVRGLIKPKETNADKNILSVISSTPIAKPLRLKQYFFDRIPFGQVLSRAFWVRPLKTIAFDLQDLKSAQKLSVACDKNTSVSGILSQIKVFEVRNEDVNHSILSRLKSFLNHLMFFSPFNFSQNVGEKVSYHGILEDQFGYVVGLAQKGLNGQVAIENPDFVSKQIEFIVNRLAQFQNYYRYALALSVLVEAVLLYYLFKWAYRNFNWSMSIFQDKHEKLEQNIPFNQACIVCYTASRSIIFKPCKHYGVCFACYKRIGQQKNCPLCKEKIQGIIQVVKKH